MAIEITMPKLSDTMEEGRILKWHKAVGERVKIGEVIGEVETDKADMELEAYDAGVLSEIRVPEGETAKVGAVIAMLDEDGDAVGNGGASGREDVSAAPRPMGDGPGGVPTAARRSPDGPEGGIAAGVTGRPPQGRVHASPLARRLARHHGVDLGVVAGSGPGGRIVADDVRAAVQGRPEPLPVAATATEARQELSRIRQTTARRMAESKREIPHFYLTAEIDMDAAVELRRQLRDADAAYATLTYTHMIVRAVALTLVRVPALNVSYEDGVLVQHGEVNVGIATATDDGLLVPVVRAAHSLSLAELSARARALAEKGTGGRYARDEMSGGTFTVSNLGTYPVAHFAAVINPPQAAILAVGAIRERPVVRDGTLAVAKTMNVTLSCDHRVVDGVAGGEFLQALKDLLENPLRLIL